MRPARLEVSRRRHMLHQAPLPAHTSALSALAGKKRKKERKTRAVDRQPSTTVGWPRGARHPVSPRHLHCLSADEVSRPLLACIIKPVITPVRRAARIACFALLSFWMSSSRLPASLQSAECSTVLPMPSYVDVGGARLCNHVVSRHIAR
jgi:hypothetical protein